MATRYGIRTTPALYDGCVNIDFFGEQKIAFHFKSRLSSKKYLTRIFINLPFLPSL